MPSTTRAIPFYGNELVIRREIIVGIVFYSAVIPYHLLELGSDVFIICRCQAPSPKTTLREDQLIAGNALLHARAATVPLCVIGLSGVHNRMCRSLLGRFYYLHRSFIYCFG
jgi:hypothetical protein